MSGQRALTGNRNVSVDLQCTNSTGGIGKWQNVFIGQCNRNFSKVKLLSVGPRLHEQMGLV